MISLVNKINAPTFIYKILYKQYPRFPLRGRAVNHPSKLINDIPIDKNIPTNVMKELFNIHAIEMRSSCEGQDKEHPSFIIFRPTNQTPAYVKDIITKLNKNEDIKAEAEKGNQGFYRIGVTFHTWYGHKGNRLWWNTLPNKIKKSI